MIASARSTLSSGHGQPGLIAPSMRRWNVTLTVDAAAAPAGRPARAPKPRAFTAELEGLLTDGAGLALPDRARAAARAFGAGDGFLPGQMIDRSI